MFNINLLKWLGFRKGEREEFSGDRRRSKRYEIPLKVSYFEPITLLEGSAFCRNISKRGVRFPIKSHLPKGTFLNLILEDPESERTILTRGRIIWIEEFITGDNAERVRYETGVRLLNRRLF